MLGKSLPLRSLSKIRPGDGAKEANKLDNERFYANDQSAGAQGAQKDRREK